jgi:ribosomal protein L37AE/L43A
MGMRFGAGYEMGFDAGYGDGVRRRIRRWGSFGAGYGAGVRRWIRSWGSALDTEMRFGARYGGMMRRHMKSALTSGMEEVHSCEWRKVCVPDKDLRLG